MQGLLLCDFDGTLYRGSDPFRYYADEISHAMPVAAREHYLGRVRACLEGGKPPAGAGDYWEAMVALARPAVTDGDVFQRAFHKTRAYMMTDRCRLEVPTGLHALMAEAEGRVVRVVASNSPEGAMIPLMKKLRLLDVFDEVRHSTGKPDGLGPLVDALLTQYHLTDREVLTVGDHYANEIHLGVTRGWFTVHIDPWGRALGPVDVSGRTFEEVLPALQGWLTRLGGN